MKAMKKLTDRGLVALTATVAHAGVLLSANSDSTNHPVVSYRNRRDMTETPANSVFYRSVSVTEARADWLAAAESKLAEMENLLVGWDGYNACAPSPFSILLANQFLDELHAGDLAPTRIAPSVVGGVGITIAREESEAYVEFYNDGGIFVMMSEGESDPLVRPVRTGRRELKSLVDELTEFLNVGSSGRYATA